MKPHAETTPAASHKTEGLVYTIGEAADLLGVSVQTLRYYEQEGLIIPFHRTSRHRRYSERDLDRLRCMRKMINVEKVSIAGIKRLLALIPCWTIKGCSDESRLGCSVTREASAPCWMVTNKSKECRNQECRICPVYTDITDCQALKRSIAGGPA